MGVDAAPKAMIEACVVAAVAIVFFAAIQAAVGAFVRKKKSRHLVALQVAAAAVLSHFAVGYADVGAAISEFG